MNVYPGGKRYQVFVSSTYRDLISERQEIINTLLTMNCFPIAMEHFPATYEEQWSYIRPLIESSDIFVCLIGGKYGSSDQNGKSYTQREFEHAMASGIPIIALYHENKEKLLAKNVDEGENAQRLKLFLQIVKTGRMCHSWKTKSDIPATLMQSILHVVHQFNPPGWQSCREKSKEFIELELEKSTLFSGMQTLKNKVKHAPIDSFPNFESASPDIAKAFNAETLNCVQSREPLKIRLLGITLHKSFPFMESIFRKVDSSCRIEIRIAILDEESEAFENLDDRWGKLGELFQEDLSRLVAFLKDKSKNIDFSIKLYKYKHMPNWHGILINYEHLFLGHCLWHDDGTLTAGQNPYDYYIKEISTTHDRKIKQFIKWFDYCRDLKNEPSRSILIFDSRGQ